MVFGHFWTILPPLEGELFTKIWEIKNFKNSNIRNFPYLKKIVYG